jgi:hypothetical protein
VRQAGHRLKNKPAGDSSETYHHACDVCGLTVGEQHWQLSDGRRMCSRCHATAIYTPGEAAVLYEQMKKVVTEVLGFNLNVPTGLALVDRIQLSEVIKRQLTGNKPGNGTDNTHPDLDSPNVDPKRTLGIYARRGIRRSIYIQTGLPRELFLQVAAHEYAHAWQGENCPLLRDTLIHEGFAEWVAYQVLGQFGYVQMQKLMYNRQDLYGEGLRWALDLQAQRNTYAVIEKCQTSV